MRLLLIRHAIAVDSGTAGIADDERPLTREGRERFAEAARGLARLVDAPDVLFTSPLLRARQTAHIARDAWGGPKPRTLECLSSGEFVPLAKALDAEGERDGIVLVGHEPHMSVLLARLVGTKRDEAFAFRKGGAALVDIPGPLSAGGRLVWFLPPRVLREIAD
jgi:phosphohistidine phosphatase